MIQYTTPTITLLVEGLDISDHDIYATLEQEEKELTKSGDDLTVEVVSTTVGTGTRTDTKLTFELAQEESGAFDFDEKVLVQVNWISSAGVRGATDIRTVPVMRNLLDEVIEYGD